MILKFISIFDFFKKYSKIILIIGVVFLVVLVVFLIKHDYKQKIKEAPIEAQVPEKKETVFSRATFFFAMPYKGGLSMPESWEGKYRMKEEGNTIRFKSIRNPDLVSDIFSIQELKKEDWEKLEKKEGEKIAEEGGYVFIYIKAKDSPYKDKDLEDFKKMQQGADEIIKSFRAFK